MTLWLNIDTKGSWSSSHSRTNLDERPCPTVNTGGVGPGNKNTHHWLEEGRAS
jgi:hypothetical protein